MSWLDSIRASDLFRRQNTSIPLTYMYTYILLPSFYVYLLPNFRVEFQEDKFAETFDFSPMFNLCVRRTHPPMGYICAYIYLPLSLCGFDEASSELNRPRIAVSLVS